MRKTLTALVLVLAAGSLAACKMPWDRPKDPEPTPVATAPETPTPDPTAVTEPSKPAEQAAATDPAKPAAASLPAAK